MKHLTILLTFFALLIFSCGPSVEGESKSWKKNLDDLSKLKKDYPGYASVIDEAIKKATTVYDAAADIKDEDKKADKMREANNMLNTGCVGGLKDMKNKVEEVKKKKSELKSLELDETDKVAVQIFIEDADAAVEKGLKVINAKGDEAKCDYVTSAYDNLKNSVDDLSKRIDDIKRKISDKKDTVNSNNNNNTTVEKDNTPKYVKCEYCGSSNELTKDKCSSCGAAIEKK